MIARLWHGWTSRENAGAYETLLRNKVLPGIHRVSGYGGAYLLKRAVPEGVECNKVLPGIHRVSGYGGAYLLKRAVPEGVEFVTITFFESLNAVRAFAGSDYEQAVVPRDARALLKRFDERSVHYEMVLGPE